MHDVNKGDQRIGALCGAAFVAVTQTADCDAERCRPVDAIAAATPACDKGIPATALLVIAGFTMPSASPNDRYDNIRTQVGVCTPRSSSETSLHKNPPLPLPPTTNDVGRSFRPGARKAARKASAQAQSATYKAPCRTILCSRNLSKWRMSSACCWIVGAQRAARTLSGAWRTQWHKEINGRRRHWNVGISISFTLRASIARVRRLRSQVWKI
jgi:hypothetical protein